MSPWHTSRTISTRMVRYIANPHAGTRFEGLKIWVSDRRQRPPPITGCLLRAGM